MTLPYERTNAVLCARDFLRRLSNVYQPDGIKGVRREIREEARRIYRHYPQWFDLGRADCFDAERARLWANEDESEEVPQSQPEWLSRPYYVDPPSGWRYGFPKLYDPATDGNMREWLVANGYPRALADQGLPCTFTCKEQP